MLAHAQGLRHAPHLQHGAKTRLYAPLMRIIAEHRDTAGVRSGQTKQHPHQRRLAGAIGAEQGQQLPRTEIEVKIAKGHDRAVALRQVAGCGHADRPRDWSAAWHFS